MQILFIVATSGSDHYFMTEWAVEKGGAGNFNASKLRWGPVRVLDGLTHCVHSEPRVGFSWVSHGFCTKKPIQDQSGLTHGDLLDPSKTHVKPMWVLNGLSMGP